MGDLLRILIYLAIEADHFTAKVEIRPTTIFVDGFPIFPAVGQLIVRGHIPTMLAHIKSHIITWALKRRKRLGADIRIYCSERDQKIVQERFQAAAAMIPPPAGLSFYKQARLCTPVTDCQTNKLKNVRWEVHGQVMAEEYLKAMMV